MSRLAKFKSKLIVILSVAITLLIGAGCSVTTVDDIKEELGLSAVVKYYANGGNFSGNLTTIPIYYKAGDKALDLGNPDTDAVKVTSGSDYVPQRTGYDFIGWYKAALVDGAPVYYEANYENNLPIKGEKVQTSDESCFEEDERFFVDYDETQPMDFSKALEKDEVIYLCAHWEKSEMLDVKFLCTDVDGVEQQVTVTGSDGKTYEKDSIVYQSMYDRNGQTYVGSESAPVFEGYTFVEYVNADGTTVDWNKIERTGTGVNQSVYAKYFVGEWTLLRTKSDVEKLFKAKEGEKFLLMNDIDCTNVTVLINAYDFNATLIGNGYSICNLSLMKTNSFKINESYSMFGVIGANAVMKNVTFKNTTVKFNGSVKINSAFNLNYFCSSVATGAILENVKIEGGVFTVDFKNAEVINLDVADKTNVAKWIGTDLATVVSAPAFDTFNEKTV